ALAEAARARGLSADAILPTMNDWEVAADIAAAVATAAVEEGLAARQADRAVFQAEARAAILQAREATAALMRAGTIAPRPTAPASERA
ncbi:MAG: malate dehydrogenase, partial [Alphaproteobacteria bacterium]|nr:malate dehydrogenase [Alphaproteobacteria bacterium]